jgi:putative aminopeptidase FrvX
MSRASLFLLATCAFLGLANFASAQSLSSRDRLYETPAVSGYEQPLANEIREQLKEFTPKSDNLGNLYVTVGHGAPHRLIVTPMDEPGYVVSDITPDGYLRVQRLPQQQPNPVFDTLHFAQPVWVLTRSGEKLSGVFAGLSVHLQPARQNAPKMAHPDEMYVDIGATSADAVRTAGVNLLDPIALNRKYQPIGNAGLADPAVGDRFGCEILIRVLSRIRESQLSGTTTVAFVAQRWTGGRGLDRILHEIQPNELIYIGPVYCPREQRRLERQ